MATNGRCKICKGYGWVCADHPDVPWDEGQGCGCGAEGMKCVCNPQAAMPPGTEFLRDVHVPLQDVTTTTRDALLRVLPDAPLELLDGLAAPERRRKPEP